MEFADVDNHTPKVARPVGFRRTKAQIQAGYFKMTAMRQRKTKLQFCAKSVGNRSSQDLVDDVPMHVG